MMIQLPETIPYSEEFDLSMVAFACIFALVPYSLVYSTYQSKSPGNLNTVFLAIQIIQGLFWIPFALMKQDLVLFISSTLSLSGYSVLTILYYHYYDHNTRKERGPASGKRTSSKKARKKVIYAQV